MQTNTNTVDTSVETKEEAMEPVWYFMDHYGQFSNCFYFKQTIVVLIYFYHGPLWSVSKLFLF